MLFAQRVHNATGSLRTGSCYKAASHVQTGKIRSIVTDVCVSVGRNRELYKMAELIAVPFGIWTRVAQKPCIKCGS